MQPDTSFPEQTRRVVRVIRFVLDHFWFIMTFLGGVVVCCALASFLEVSLLRGKAITLSVIFTLVAWSLIFVMAVLRQWDTDNKEAERSSFPPPL